VLYALFGLNRAGQILCGTLIVLAAAAFAGWQILPSLQFSDQDEQLFRAARHGNRAAVEQALSAGASLEHTSPVDRKTVLFRAAVFVHADVVRLLLERGADPDAVGADGALVEGGVDVNCQPGPNTPLVAAIEARDVALMTYLEAHGAREKP
jgi:hypothetical protein